MVYSLPWRNMAIKVAIHVDNAQVLAGALKNDKKILTILLTK